MVFNALVGLASFMVVPAWANDCVNSFSGVDIFEMTSGNDQISCGKGDFSNINGLGGDDDIYFTNWAGDLNINGNIQFEMEMIS